MPSLRIRSWKTLNRRNCGSQIVEFGAALGLLIACVFLPMIDLSIVPVRWMMAQEIINAYSRQLAFCETFSQSYRTMEADPSLTTRLTNLGGIKVKSIQLYLRITRIAHNNETLVVEMPKRIPPEWLPNGSKSPCSYSLVLNVQSLLSPAVLFPGGGDLLPGVTAPFPMSISASHEWENFGKNPVTGKFFLNE